MSNYRISGAAGEWPTVIGHEVHVQATADAMQSSATSKRFAGKPARWW